MKKSKFFYNQFFEFLAKKIKFGKKEVNYLYLYSLLIVVHRFRIRSWTLLYILEAPISVLDY